MKLRIGSRGSQLAVTQTEWIGRELAKANPGLEIVYSRITTTGDREAGAIQALGGKGAFVKEIEEALLRKDIDLAVHSLKDVPQALPAGLRLGGFPKREDNREAVISRFGELIGELPKGSIVGTSSPHRHAQIAQKYAKRNYRIQPLRGDVDTRMRKLQAGDYDAIILAAAGLRRLGLEREITQILEIEEMIPAPGQGCLGLELREDDEATWKIVEAIKDPVSDLTARAERAFLMGLGGNCLIPVGAAARVDGDQIRMIAVLAEPDGSKVVHSKQDGPASAPELVGAQLAERLLYDGGSEIMMKLESHG